MMKLPLPPYATSPTLAAARARPYLTRLRIIAVVVILIIYTIFSTTNSQQQVLKNYEALTGKRYGELDDINNSTLGFQQVYVINMATRFDRVDVWSLVAPYYNITFEYIDGVVGSEVNKKAYPAGWDDANYTPETLGCARSHLNVYQKMVQERISSAIVLESDADWDVMLRHQLREYARGQRFLQGYEEDDLTYSPYGDDWDLGWIGHCGITSDTKASQDYWVIEDDPTCLPHSMFGFHPSKTLDTKPDALNSDFTRIVLQRPQNGLCTVGYIISLRGAEKMLLHFSLQPAEPGTQPSDDNLRTFCEKEYSNAKCFAPFPPFIEHYKAAGNRNGDSDREEREGVRWKPKTMGTIFPLRPNLDRLMRGEMIIPSQFNHSVMLDEINPFSYNFPKGRGVFVRKEEFE